MVQLALSIPFHLSLEGRTVQEKALLHITVLFHSKSQFSSRSAFVKLCQSISMWGYTGTMPETGQLRSFHCMLLWIKGVFVGEKPIARFIDLWLYMDRISLHFYSSFGVGGLFEFGWTGISVKIVIVPKQGICNFSLHGDSSPLALWPLLLCIRLSFSRTRRLCSTIEFSSSSDVRRRIALASLISCNHFHPVVNPV